MQPSPTQTIAPIPASKRPPGAEPATVSLPETGFVRLKLLLRFVPFSKTTLWRRVKEGLFPPPVKLSAGIVAWRAEDLRRWIAEQG